MKSEFTIRKKLGISQQDLADYLSVSRSLFALTERGLRSLPTKALVKLSKLELSNKSFPATGIKKSPTAETTKHQAALKKKLQKRIGACNFFATKMKRELSVLKQQSQQGAALFQTIQHLFGQLPGGREGAQEKLWLEIQQVKTLKKMQRTDETAQALLQLKISILEYEARELGKLL